MTIRTITTGGILRKRFFAKLFLLFIFFFASSGAIFAANNNSLSSNLSPEALPLNLLKHNQVYLNQNSGAFSIPPDQALQIAMKIWYNECGGTIEGLTSWSYGEDFASLGIGHFTWYSTYGRTHTGTGTFPGLVKYIVAHNNSVQVPTWLLSNNQVAACPWNSRNQFKMAKYGHRMNQLRTFLVNTIPLQADYMVHRLKKALPKIVAEAPKSERTFVYKKFNSLMETAVGTYALVDYLNFKGSGINAYVNYKSGKHDGDWGLLQVLETMRQAPKNFDNLTAFVWAARQVLIQRVYYADPKKHEERWLVGWLNRVDKYLLARSDIDYQNTAIVD